MSERSLTPHPCLVPSLSVRKQTNNVSGTGVEKVESRVTYVSRLHIVKKGDGESEDEGNGEWGTSIQSKKVEGLNEDEIEDY